MLTLFLCGAGNSEGVRLACSINRQHSPWDRVCLLDDDVSKHGKSLVDVPIEGSLDLLSGVGGEAACVVNLVARTTSKRRAVYARLQEFGLPFASLRHPDIDVMGTTLVADDIVAYHHATLGPEVSIDTDSVVFMGAIVGHECKVGRHCIIGANAVLNARVRLHDGVYVGTNATVLPEVTVGSWATIGAGSVVIQDVPPGATVMGVPAQVIARREDGTDEASSVGRAQDSETLPTNPPRANDEIQQVIRRIWQDALSRVDIGDHDNFFDLGGDSLCALRVHGRIQQALDCEFPLTDIFRLPTVQALAFNVGKERPRAGIGSPGGGGAT
jgi:sugar O-acyltransferase (sialic acid O-acetyltransferase NeuD family)